MNNNRDDELHLGTVTMEDLQDFYGMEDGSYEQVLSTIIDGLIEEDHHEEDDVQEEDLENNEDNNEESVEQEDSEFIEELNEEIDSILDSIFSVEGEVNREDVEDVDELDDSVRGIVERMGREYNSYEGDLLEVDTVQKTIIEDQEQEDTQDFNQEEVVESVEVVEEEEEVEVSEYDRLDNLYKSEYAYKLAGDLYQDVNFSLKEVGRLYDVVGGTISRNIRELGYSVPSERQGARQSPEFLPLEKELYERIKYRLMKAYGLDMEKCREVFRDLFSREMIIVEQGLQELEEVVEYDRGVSSGVTRLSIKELAKKRLEDEDRYEKQVSEDVESIIWLYKELEGRIRGNLAGVYDSNDIRIGLVATYPNGLSVNYQDINRLELLGENMTTVALGIGISEDIREYFPYETSEIDRGVDEVVEMFNLTYGKENKAKVTNMGGRKVVGIKYE